MDLVIAEKPDIAKAVSKVIPGTPSWKNGYIEQGNYCITWCYGHLLTLKDPEDYGDEYARENTPNEKLPIFFDNWGTKVADKGPALLKNGSKAPDKGEQVKTIGELLKKASLVIVAGDIDDEGQLLVEELLEWHRYSGPIKRLDTGALNEASLKKAMANLMDNAPWHMKAVSARARSVADFALGINGSRFFSNTYGANLSVGRVQTAALGLVVARDAQIEGHTSQKYFLLDVDVALEGNGTHQARFSPSKDDPHLVDGKILDRSYLEKLGQAVSGRKFEAEVTKEPCEEAPPLPFSISALKSYCSEKFNIPPEETLRITQSLRMNYGGLITYNRSECRYLPENMHAEAPGIIAAVQANLGAGWAFPGLNSSIKSKAFNDKNVGVHHAIIPTAQKADISKLSEKEQIVYRAVCGFYMVQFMPNAKKERTRLTIPGKGGSEFSAVSTRLVSKGFKQVLRTQDDEVSALSNVPAGKYPCVLSNPSIQEKETKPPKRYTDSSLEEDMKNVAKYVTDPEAKRLLLLKDKESREEHGSIGTAATRSAIIQTLKKRGFLCNEGKNVISTPLGREFYKILPDEIRKPDLTAKWWAIQQEIQDGNAKPEDLYQEVLAAFHRVASIQYPKIQLSNLAGAAGRKSIGTCPRCGKPIVEGKKGYGCSGYREGCTFTIWKEGQHGVYKVLAASKKKLTEAMVKKLLSEGKVLVRGLMSERTGKTYDAYITMESTEKGVLLNLSFDNIPAKKTAGKKKGGK
ncbi:DNA topoisomerase [Ruthenibacterium lactatiformans]|uniref:type IA DNA topoisomerase n=1 Tax=Ruthenibacterium lactatiformans TaxID=1550024 RepID=UPI003AB39EAA